MVITDIKVVAKCRTYIIYIAIKPSLEHPRSDVILVMVPSKESSFSKSFFDLYISCISYLSVFGVNVYMAS